MLYGELLEHGRLTGYAKATRRNDHDALYLTSPMPTTTPTGPCRHSELVEWVVIGLT